MTLDQEHNEQARWLAHLAQERQALSSSMEATLAEGNVLDEEDDWDDVPQSKSSANQSLIPPRLSLQSKVLPTVKPEKSVPSATGVVESTVSSADNNIFMRLARRLTSSLAALTLPPSADAAVNTPAANARVEVRPEMARDYNTERAASYTQQQSHSMQVIQDSEVYHPAKEAYIVDALPASAPSTNTNTDLLSQEKRRLAGHTAKIRLQTTDMPAVVVKTKEPDAPFMKPVPTPVQAIKEQPIQQEISSAVLDSQTSNVTGRGARETSVQLPAIPRGKQEETPVRPRKTLTGTGTFECGQGDVMVENSHVTDASVVIVTLTSNPGPVVVQYVSLYPHVGFTVHLTAPAVAKTSFNYIILLGELF